MEMTFLDSIHLAIQAVAIDPLPLLSEPEKYPHYSHRLCHQISHCVPNHTLHIISHKLVKVNACNMCWSGKSIYNYSLLTRLRILGSMPLILLRWWKRKSCLKDRFNYEYLIGYPSHFAGTNNCRIEMKHYCAKPSAAIQVRQKQCSLQCCVYCACKCTS